jgi:hypothetical protein
VVSRHYGAALGVVTAVTGIVSAGGCNAILGINAATAENDADSGSGTGDGTTIDATPELTCDFYCATVMRNCQGANSEYVNTATCMTACPIFEPGTTYATDTMDDTLGCRIYHALAAAGDPSYHCRHAGPVGGNHCGDPCQAFCNLVTSYCAAPNPVAYASPGACKNACKSGSFPYLTSDAGDLSLTSGDTLNCRIYHLEAAMQSASAASYHCPHTEAVSAVCFNPSGAADAPSE